MFAVMGERAQLEQPESRQQEHCYHERNHDDAGEYNVHLVLPSGLPWSSEKGDPTSAPTLIDRQRFR
jgi:hypothetical protein